MGYTVRIRGRYWRPLGTLQHVQREFEKAFPSATFAVQEEPKLLLSQADRVRAASRIKVGAVSQSGAGGPLHLIVGLVLRSILRLSLVLHAVGPPTYPYVSGYMEGDGYAVEFFLGSGPIVRKVYLTFYGRDWEVPGRQCDQLIANTGWILKA
jgi:hypothetical protein